MDTKLTNVIKNFENSFQKSIFAGKACAAKEQFYQLVSKANIKYRRVVKYIGGHWRLRYFLIDSIRNFDMHHRAIVTIIEKGELLDNPEKKIEYEYSKHSIGILLRANKRMNRKKIATKEKVVSCLGQYIHENRMRKTLSVHTLAIKKI